MLIIQNLTIENNQGKKLIEDFSLTLKDKDRYAIIGEEGNGKSTLLKAIIDPKLIEYTTVSGNVDVQHTRIGYLKQQMDICWNECTCDEYCLKEDVNEEIPYEKYNELAQLEKSCIQLHLDSDFLQRDTKIKDLSGGEKVKLQLLKLMNQPINCLFLDEPTNDLDLETLQWLENFLLECPYPVLFISHDEVLLSKVATGIILLEQVNKKTKVRHTIQAIGYDAFMQERKLSIQKEEQLASKEKEEYLKKKEKLNRIMSAVHDAQNSVSRQDPATARLLKKKMHAVKSMERRFEKESYTRLDTLEEAIDVSFESFDWNPQKIICDLHYDEIKVENNLLIEDVKLYIKGNEKVVITGKNGCGKSTLIRQVMKDLQNRKDIKIGYMPQNYADSMNLSSTLIDFLVPNLKKEEVTTARNFLGRMKFTRDEMVSKISNLSEGQKAKLYLLKFILDKCNVLILDEPTRNLSPLSNPQVRKMLKEFNGAILSISHDRKYIEEVCDFHYVIENKQFKCIKDN